MQRGRPQLSGLRRLGPSGVLLKQGFHPRKPFTDIRHVLSKAGNFATKKTHVFAQRRLILYS